MVDYEIIHEILNLCPGNQMRDVFIEEIQLPENADLEEYVREKFKNEGELKLIVQTEQMAVWFLTL